MFAKQRAVLAIVAVGMFGTLSSCTRPPSCPTTVDQASSGDYEVIGDNTFVGTGFAIRFVAAEEADARGYDLNVTRWIHGHPGDAGIFLLSERIPGIGPGQPVLIVVEATDNELAYIRGACDPLHPITEEDALRN